MIPANVDSSLGVDSAAFIAKYSEGIENQFVDKTSLNIVSDFDDSISKFERNLLVLLPNLYDGTESTTLEQPQGSRRSERPKKPSLRLNEDAGFLDEPLKSAKKKVLKRDNLEGTTSKPLLISDWFDAQISSYYNVCGINFYEFVHDCITYIRMLEKRRAAPSRGLAATSSEVCEF